MLLSPPLRFVQNFLKPQAVLQAGAYLAAGPFGDPGN
jgi:hypothetical protein